MRLWKNWWKTTSWPLGRTGELGGEQRGLAEHQNHRHHQLLLLLSASVSLILLTNKKSFQSSSDWANTTPTSLKPLPGQEPEPKTQRHTSKQLHQHMSLGNEYQKKKEEEEEKHMGSSFSTQWLSAAEWNYYSPISKRSIHSAWEICILKEDPLPELVDLTRKAKLSLPVVWQLSSKNRKKNVFLL